MEGKDKVVEAGAVYSGLIFKALYLLMTLMALSVGLAFYFLVPGRVGYGVGVAMFVVTALTFVAGEIAYYANARKLCCK